MKILIAPDSFKGSLTALEAAQAIYEGLESSNLKSENNIFPIADGGEGSLAVILNHKNGQRKTIGVEDPLGRITSASYGLINEGKVAVIELAEASGMALLKKHELDPLQASTFGTGQLIADALRQNVEEVVLTVGGSSTVDGGAGILQALGVKLLDREGNTIPKGGGGLSKLATIDLNGVDQQLQQTKLTILCDVENPLLGERGTAAIFGPQKGADHIMVKELESCLRHFSEIIKQKVSIDIRNLTYGGAAGGVAAGLHALLDAKLVKGIDYIIALSDFDEIIKSAAIVITGEGKFDSQTMQGKGPWGVTKKAKENNKPVIMLAGQVEHKPDNLSENYPDVVLSIISSATNPEENLKYAAKNLKNTATQIGNLLAIGAGIPF